MPQDHVSSLLYTHSTESMSCKRQATSQSKPQMMLTCMRSNIKVGGVGFRDFEREGEGGGYLLQDFRQCLRGAGVLH